MKVTAKTKHLGIIGNPVGHSFSPIMHNFISDVIGNDCIYTAFSVDSNNLKDAMDGIRALGICGVNVTAPHKIAVTEYLDEIDKTAKLLGSVNTVVNKNGRLIGYNTDSEGFYMSLVKSGITVKNNDILIMGCGGVVMPILIRMIKESPKSITLLNRTASKAEILSDKIYSLTGFRVATKLENEKFDVLINTTSAGMGDQKNKLPQDDISELGNADIFSKAKAAVDLIYNPQCTKFLEMAKSRGIKVLNGLDMLIYQGILSYELFCDTILPENISELIKKEVFHI